MTARKPRLSNVVSAFAAAPLAGAVLAAVLSFLVAVVSGALAFVGSLVTMSFFVTAGVGYCVAVLLGIPGYLLLRRLGWVRRPHWVLLCAALGAATGMIVPALQFLTAETLDTFWPLLGGFVSAGALIGTASGLLFARIIRIEPPGVDEIAATFD